MEAEHALIERAVRGDGEALEAIAAAHRPAVLRTARHLLGNEEWAEDVTQDVFVRLHAALPGFRGESALGTWLYRITLNLCRDHMRTRAFVSEVPLAAAPERSTPDPDPTRAVALERARHALGEAIGRLPEDQQEVIALRFFSDLPYAEIARITGMPQGTVASRVFRALKRLGRDLEPIHLEVTR